jgi:flagellar hook-basal body complex protein FliE
MSILPVGLTQPAAVSQVMSATPTAPTSPTPGTGSPTSGSNDFANTLTNALDSLSTTQANADNLATQAATGSLTNVADYMVAAEQANIQTQLTAAVKTNALQAFQQIMGMQL